MRLHEIESGIKKNKPVTETSSSASTSTGSIASVPISTGLMIKRMPTEPNLFGYIPKNPKKRRKNKR